MILFSPKYLIIGHDSFRMVSDLFYPLKHVGKHIYPKPLHSVALHFPTQFICGFCMTVRTNICYFTNSVIQPVVCHGDAVFFEVRTKVTCFYCSNAESFVMSLR